MEVKLFKRKVVVNEKTYFNLYVKVNDKYIPIKPIYFNGFDKSNAINYAMLLNLADLLED